MTKWHQLTPDGKVDAIPETRTMETGTRIA